MLTDVFVFDQVRYLYDFVPSMSLFGPRLGDAHQFILRICMDAIGRHAYAACPELFRGSALASCGEAGFASIDGLNGLSSQRSCGAVTDRSSMAVWPVACAGHCPGSRENSVPRASSALPQIDGPHHSRRPSSPVVAHAATRRAPFRTLRPECPECRWTRRADVGRLRRADAGIGNCGDPSRCGLPVCEYMGQWSLCVVLNWRNVAVGVSALQRAMMQRDYSPIGDALTIWRAVR